MRLEHRLDGQVDGPVLVLSGSLGTDLELWSPNVASWSGAFRVLRYDHRGHGGSDVPPGPYTVEELGRDLLALLDRLGVERASFCGTSLGGAACMWLAAAAPERVDRLVLACTSATFGDPARYLERARTVRAEGVAAVAEAVLAVWFTPRFADEQPAVVDRFREGLLATPAEGYAACCEAVAGWDFRGGLGAIRAPTLVVAGADDPATPPDHAAFLADRIADAKLVVLRAAAHLANIERAAAFSDAVAEHLALQEVA